MALVLQGRTHEMKAETICGWCGCKDVEIVAKDDDGKSVCVHCADKYNADVYA